jgi:hypothetical protein
MADPITDRTEADLVARMRADGFPVRAATRDTTMDVASERKDAFIARLRAAGLKVTPATVDTLPPPEHTLPPKNILPYLLEAWRRVLGFRRSGRVNNAPVP